MSAPYLRVISGPGGTHVLFAAQVEHWPFDRMAQHPWPASGSDQQGDLQAQWFGHQLRFIGALHPGLTFDHEHCAEVFTVDLRYLYRPDAKQIDCVLVGKVFDPDEAKGKQAAQALFEKLMALVPIGYALQPASSDAEFSDWTGEDLAQKQDDPHLQWAEIRRPAEFLLWTARNVPARHLPVVYPFAWNSSGWEGIWMAQFRLGRPSLISVSLCPTEFPLAEESILANLAADFYAVAAEAHSPLSPHAPPELASAAGSPLALQAAEFAALYTDYLSALRQPFSMRVSVLGPRPLWLAVRSALSGPAWPPDQVKFHLAVAAEIVEPGEAHLQTVRENFERLEQTPWNPYPAVGMPPAPLLERLRYLTGVEGALCAFRLPLLSADGLPGVKVGAEISP